MNLPDVFEFTYPLADLREFKEHYVASDYALTLTGSYLSDKQQFPGWWDQVFLLLAIDNYGETSVKATLKAAQEAWGAMHGA